MLTDAHVHLHDCFIESGSEPDMAGFGLACVNSRTEEEFLWNERLGERYPGRLYHSFGIHPQAPGLEALEFLNGLAREGRIAAVGEIGFDAWKEYRDRLGEQKAAWDAQLEIALSFGLPLVIHCRKALNMVFADSRRLKRLPAVVFHGWPGSPAEAKALLSRGINAWFSAGKGLLRGDVSLAASVAELGPGRILAETDAPWMTLRSESYSLPSDIRSVQERIAGLWSMPTDEAEGAIAKNFFTVFGNAR